MKTPDTQCPLDLSKLRITLIDAQNEICIDSSDPDVYVYGPVVWDSLLLAAVFEGPVEMRVEPLPDASVDASLDSNSVTVIRGLEGILTYLLDSGAQVNAITKVEEISCTPLLAAISERNVPALKVLLDRDADVNQVLGGRITPLLIATDEEDGEQNEDMVKLLLEHGADVNFADNKGVTVLMRLAKGVDFCMMDLLLEAGADMDAVNLDGLNARQIFAQVYRDHFTAPDGGDFMQHKLFATGSWSCVALGMELWATGYWGAPCGAGHDRIKLLALINSTLSQGKSGMAREFLVARSLFGPEKTFEIDLSSHLERAVNALDWKMIDVLSEFGADIDAPVDTGITSLELATDALEKQLTRQLEENEGIPAVIQNAILQAIEEVKHGPIQGTLHAAIDSAVCLAIKTALPEAIAAAINARTPHAVAVDGLLKTQLAFASCDSHTELEATLALIVRHLESPLGQSAWSSSIVETGSFSSVVTTKTITSTSTSTSTTNAKHLKVNVCADDLVLVDVSFCLDDWNEDSAYSPSEGTYDHSATHGLVEAPLDDDSNIAVPEYLGFPAGEPML